MQQHYGKIAMTAGSALLVGIGVGVLITLPFTVTKISPQYDVGFRAGFEDARLKLSQSGILPAEPEKTMSISGVIASVRGNSIMFKADPTVLNPLETPAPTERALIIAPDTKLTRLVQKTPEQFGKEQAAWIAAIQTLKPGEAPTLPPSPATDETISITDIKTGDRFTVTSDQNIKMLQKFEAKAIMIAQ